MLDADATKQAEVIADQLEGLIPSVDLIKLVSGDPERQNKKNIKLIKKYLQN